MYIMQISKSYDTIKNKQKNNTKNTFQLKKKRN